MVGNSEKYKINDLRCFAVVEFVHKMMVFKNANNIDISQIINFVTMVPKHNVPFKGC